MKTAFIIVDVQNDFISGSLALKNGEQIVPEINRILENHEFDSVIYTKDWHPVNHISFHENRELWGGKTEQEAFSKVTLKNKLGDDYDQVLWPTHCVQGSNGAELHKDLIVKEGSFEVKKGLTGLWFKNSEIRT